MGQRKFLTRTTVGIALGGGLGVALGGVVLPRLLRPELYNETYPPLMGHALLAFAVAAVSGFAVLAAIYWIKRWMRKSEYDQ